jgi:hypothetical protein
MAASVLGTISLGYQLLWNRQRQPVAVKLFVDCEDPHKVDARHLLHVLHELWAQKSPQLLLAIQSPQLLLDVLDHGIASAPHLIIPHAMLAHPDLLQRAKRAHARGLHMVWQGASSERPEPAIQALFSRRLNMLSANQALRALGSFLKNQGDDQAAASNTSPIEPGQIYEGVANADLIQHCLNQQGAWALAGWPMEEVLHGQPQQVAQAGIGTLQKLLTAIDADASLELIEHLLSEEPILAYRFLCHVNSTATAQRNEIDNFRRGLMVLGLSSLKAWLLAQRALASQDLNLQPIRIALVTRAHLMERLLDAGEAGDLRREVYWCGLLSQMDRLLNEPITTALKRLLLPQRIEAALIEKDGPYLPYLEIAAALESDQTRVTLDLCQTHGISQEDVNRALLKTLAAMDSRPAG